MSGVVKYQKNISGSLVAQMVMEFQQRLRDVYPTDVMVSALCAVGPLQTMIGLGIELGAITTPDAPVEAPKCTSVWGHKFEARYSHYSPSEITMEAGQGLSADMIKAAGLYKAYEGDVCTRCGCIVNRPTPSKEQ